MSYLDDTKLPEIVARYYGSEEDRRHRLVGLNRSHDSAYFEIRRFFGAGAFDSAAVRLEYLLEPFHLSDPLIQGFASKVAEQLRAEGRLYSGPSVLRLSHFDPDSTSPVARVQAADYGDQAGSSFALDYPDPVFKPWGGTLRDYYKATYLSLELSDNPLGVCLGVCGMLLIEEGKRQSLLMVQRHGRLASLEASAGPSIAGVVDYREDFRTLADVLRIMLEVEAQEELGLSAGDITVVPLSYAREIFRGDRPQLFGLVRTAISRHELDRMFTNRQDLEFESYEFVELTDGRLTEDRIGTLNFEAQMSYYMAEEYLAESI